MEKSIFSNTELFDLYKQPLLKLVSQAHHVHATYHDVVRIQLCHLISVKTGGCTENCKYCAQSSHYRTSVTPSKMLDHDTVIRRAKKAISSGAKRICLGSAWREVKSNKAFSNILRIVKSLSSLGVEVCCTLGMLTLEEAIELKKAGLYAYNHNLDTSPSYYPSVVTTRTYQERLDTLKKAREAGLTLCCGGILGMGESVQDRIDFLSVLTEIQPESVPLNLLAPIAGTPFGNLPPINFWEYLRLIAVARIALPKSKLRLSAGRIQLSKVEQSLCFFAGINSIFIGDTLLTVSNPEEASDQDLLQTLGVHS